MKQKLLSLKPNVYYDISQHHERESIIEAIKDLTMAKHDFLFTENKDKFMLVKVHEPEKKINCFFDLKEEQGYSVVKRGRHEELYYNGKLLSIR